MWFHFDKAFEENWNEVMQRTDALKALQQVDLTKQIAKALYLSGMIDGHRVRQEMLDDLQNRARRGTEALSQSTDGSATASRDDKDNSGQAVPPLPDTSTDTPAV